MRCSLAPVARQVRPAFPVFQWISGWTSTTCMGGKLSLAGKPKTLTEDTSGGVLESGRLGGFEREGRDGVCAIEPDEPFEMFYGLEGKAGLGVEGVAGGRAGLGRRGIVLRHLLHLAERLTDLFEAVRLLTAGLADVVDERLHLGDAIGDLLHRGADLLDPHGAAVGALDRLLDQRRGV